MRTKFDICIFIMPQCDIIWTKCFTKNLDAKVHFCLSKNGLVVLLAFIVTFSHIFSRVGVSDCCLTPILKWWWCPVCSMPTRLAVLL